MYLAGVSVCCVEDITKLLWGSRISASTVSSLNQKVLGKIEDWRNRPLSGEYPYVFVDGIYLKRNWGGEMTGVSVLVAIGVSEYGCREILGACEVASESKECWRSFLVDHHGTRPEWRKVVRFGQAPGLPGIGLGSVPGCEMATLYCAFLQEPDDEDPA